jgi:deoxyribonuclease V
MTVAQAREIQQEMRGQLIRHPPAGFSPRLIAGADVSVERFKHYGYAALVVLRADTLEVVGQAATAAELRFPYVPGYLSFRELPPLQACWWCSTARVTRIPGGSGWPAMAGCCGTCPAWGAPRTC